MRRLKKVLVYRSKNEEDWAKARALLQEAGMECFPFAAEEPPVPGCGAKIDPRKFLNRKPVPTTIYQIEVTAENKEKAETALAGKVLPVRSYGFSI